MPCNKAHIAHLLEEKRRSREGGRDQYLAGNKSGRRERQKGRQRQEVGKARLLKGNIVNVHRVCSQWL